MSNRTKTDTHKSKLTKCLILLFTSLLLLVAVGCKDSTKGEETLPTQTSNAQDPDDINVLFINIGDGESIVVHIQDQVYLIDTGRKEDSNRLINALQARDIKKIDGVFLTHRHKDHIGGMKRLASEYEIEKLYSARISLPTDSGTYKIDELAKDLSLEHIKLSAGDEVPVTDDISFEVLGPIVLDEKDDNDNSLVLRLTLHGRRFLFTGDMQFREEKTLLDAGVDLQADVLSVGNHGNPDATSEAFAKAVSPVVAIISTDTTIDKNAANKRVKALFEEGSVYVTEDYNIGILVTVQKNGAIVVDYQ